MLRLDASFTVCDAHLASTEFGLNQTDGKNLIDILQILMPQFDTFEKCRWRNKDQKCEELFHKYITDDGVCYSFNALSSKEIFKTEV